MEFLAGMLFNTWADDLGRSRAAKRKFATHADIQDSEEKSRQTKEPHKSNVT